MLCPHDQLDAIYCVVVTGAQWHADIGHMTVDRCLSCVLCKLAMPSGGYGAVEPHMPFILSSLLDVALALRHLHALQLVHGDVKPSNVLLKSHLGDPRGFTAKLSDFGMVKIMKGVQDEFDMAFDSDCSRRTSNGTGTGTSDLHVTSNDMGGMHHDRGWSDSLTTAQQTKCSAELAQPVPPPPPPGQAAWETVSMNGTITHLPPEVLAGTGVADYSMDVYAFGIMMWEVLMGVPLYGGLGIKEIRHKVAQVRCLTCLMCRFAGF